MDKIAKLFLKISKKDRKSILELLEFLECKRTEGLDILKIKNTDFYRLKKGRFRIIFHHEEGVVLIDSIRLRNEKTYRNLE